MKSVQDGKIWLQEVGFWDAKPASAFVVGDFAVWNGGHTSEILSIVPKGASQLAWKIQTADGKIWDRVVKAPGSWLFPIITFVEDFVT